MIEKQLKNICKHCGKTKEEHFCEDLFCNENYHDLDKFEPCESEDKMTKEEFKSIEGETKTPFRSLKEIEKGCGKEFNIWLNPNGVRLCDTCGDEVYIEEENRTYDIRCSVCQAQKQNTLAIIKMIDELGELWEVAFECGEKTGEFEYIQFKEHPLFNKIKQELTGVK